MSKRHAQGKSHKHREDLTGEHPSGDTGQLILACLFAAIWIADTFFLKYTMFLNQSVSVGFRIPLGILLLALSGYLIQTSHHVIFGEESGEPGVIREGIYGIVRHPMYLSEILLYLGFLMLSISLAAAAVWIVAIGFLHYISRYEEKLLLGRFGEEYEQYMREVPMWIPRFWKR